MSRPPPGDPERVPGPDPGGHPDAAGTPPLTRLLVLVGPTGTGKSEVAVAVAGRLGGEIVGCDALQVYRGFDTATAKPDPGARRRVPHHLIDVADPLRDYSVADYVRDADRAITEIAARGGIPIVAGGTGMYLRGLLKGLVLAPPRDPALRARLREMGSRFGSARLHRWLRSLDPASAGRIPPGDSQRIARALEIRLSGGRRAWSDRLAREGTWSASGERYDAIKAGLDLPGDLLRERLARRVASFFDAGLVAEVRRLLASGVPATANAFKAIGYREVVAALERGHDPESVRDEVVRHTVRYAKRQRTWFRTESGVRWIDASDGVGATAARIVALWEGGAI